MSDRSGIWSRPLFNCSLRAWQRLFARYPESPGRALRLRIGARARLASALESMQERLFAEQLDSLTLTDPVFIIGHWRSGTTLLHELMALDEQLLTPTTHQCFNPQSFLLSRPSRSAGSAVVRPAGDRMVSAESPQEEEFALLCLGCVSPYEAFVFPQAFRSFETLCDPSKFTATERSDWERRLVRFLKAVTFAGGGRRLLLKSPSNSFRVRALLQLFPNAVFVQIVRDPNAVITSTIHMWKTMWQRYALGAPLDDQTLRDFTIDVMLRLENELQKQCSSASGFITVRYEDLVAQSQRVIGKVFDELGVGVGPSEDRVGRLLAISPSLRPSHRADARLAALLRERCAAIFERYGYA